MDTKDPTSLLGALTDRRLAALRLVMAVVATLILYFIANEPRRYPNLTYYSLLAYVAYSVALYVASRRRINFSETVAHGLVWVDLAWYTVLTALSNGSDSLFFFFFLPRYEFLGCHARWPRPTFQPSGIGSKCDWEPPSS